MGKCSIPVSGSNIKVKGIIDEYLSNSTPIDKFDLVKESNGGGNL